MKQIVFVLMILLAAAGCNATENVDLSAGTSEERMANSESQENSSGAFQKKGPSDRLGFATMAYEGDVALEGFYTVSYPETLGGGMVFFSVDDAFATKLPSEEGFYTNGFTFANEAEAKKMLKIDTSAFTDKSICEITGKAKIVVKGYELLMAGVDGSSMTTLKSAANVEGPTLVKCPSDDIR